MNERHLNHMRVVEHQEFNLD